MSWKCAECGHQDDDYPKGICSNCGLVQMGPGTHEKYKILEKYCSALSLIMRHKGIKHCFIDACAGSGIVQAYKGDNIRDGSPLIMAKTREKVQETIRDKTKEPSVNCKFIECNKKTYKILRRETKNYVDFCECLLGDCNIVLNKVLDKVKGDFSFIYIDPFGLGEPVIRYKTVEQVLKRDFTELFIHFSWQGVSRAAGLLRNINHHDEVLRKKACSAIKTLDSYLTPEWREIQKNVKSPSERKRRFVSLYESKLKQYYPGVKYVEIPIGSKNPDYYLFFTTRHSVGYKIMDEIIEKMRRKGVERLDKDW